MAEDDTDLHVVFGQFVGRRIFRPVPTDPTVSEMLRVASQNNLKLCIWELVDGFLTANKDNEKNRVNVYLDNNSCVTDSFDIH